MQSLNVRLTLVIFTVAVVVFATVFILMQVVYIDAVGHRQIESLALLEAFSNHPDSEDALRAMPEDLARTFADLQRQLVQTANFLQLLRRWRWLAAPLFLSVLAPLIILLSLFVSRRLTLPLRTVADSARRLAEGDFTVRTAPNPKSWDSYSLALAEDFNAMAASLEQLNNERQNMVADIAHELRTPLTAVQLQLEAVQDGIDPLTPEVIDHLYDETRLLSRLIVDLRTLSLAEANQLSLELAALDLRSLVAKTLLGFENEARAKAISLRLEGSEGVLLEADAERLRQILSNLVSNALRHTPEGGSVRVKFELQKGWVQISVEDSGTGLSDEALAHVFDRFYRSGSARVRAEGGSGLGLAIVKALTELHGGTVAVNNRDKDGAVFTLRFRSLEPHSQLSQLSADREL